LKELHSTWCTTGGFFLVHVVSMRKSGKRAIALGGIYILALWANGPACLISLIQCSSLNKIN